MQILRPYQEAASAAVWQAEEDFLNNVLICLPTATGKTTILSEIVKEALSRGWDVLVTAHRSEIVDQLYKRIRDNCGLCVDSEIGMEIDTVRAPHTARVICASVQSIIKPERIKAFKERCRLLLVDEAHHAAADTYRAIATQCGVDRSECYYVGCTATPKRGDKQSLYALLPDGSPVKLKDNKGNEFDAEAKDCVFEKMVYHFPMDEAIEGGWIVEPKGHIVKSETDLSNVKTRLGDFEQKGMSDAVDNAERTLEAIQGWKDAGADDRSTVVFCASVEHAHHSKELFEKAGYTAGVVDGATDKLLRFKLFDDFASGRVQVLCNMGVATEGTDLVNCGCIIHLRPTQNWGLYMQMTGRGLRPNCHLLNEWTDEERKAAIASSVKKDCIVIDVVDITKGKDLCTVPSILDLPVKMDLQGKGVSEVQKMLKEYDEVKGQVIGECPVTYEELKVRLEAVSLLRQSNARSREDWAVTEHGYRFQGVRPGYSVEMVQSGGTYCLQVKHRGNTVIEKTGKPGADFKAYLDSAQRRAKQAIDEHAAAQPQASRGTLQRLTEKQAKVLLRKHSRQEVDAMPYAKARALIGSIMEEWRSKQTA